MSKKYVVIHDLEDFPLKNKDGGMYAIMPYERTDRHGNALFKVGQADDFKKRFESYHTYYPLGFYYKNLLANPRANRKGVDGKRLGDKTYYNKVENFIHKDIVEHGGTQLKTTTRIKNSKKNVNNLGDTEWFYTDEKTLDKAFDDAHNKFGGNKYNASVRGINTEADKNEKAMNKNKKGDNYKAEIYYKIR